MHECSVVALLEFAVFLGCICIGFVLAAAAQRADDDAENK